MKVHLEDGSEEVWTDGEEPVAKITSPHGWSKKFGVSKKPWSSVKDRSKPCQFAIIKKNEDGSFSKSKSGFPHHLPGCSTINRGGIGAAAARLVQALKSNMPEIEIPPIVSLAVSAIGQDEFDAYIEEAARFSHAELVFAAKHIARHYRRDIKEDPPENLVAVAKATDENDIEYVAELIRDLVTMVKEEDIKMPEDTIVQDVTPAEAETTETIVEEAPVVEETAEIEQEEETVTETVEAEAETVSEEEEPEAEAAEPEVAGEPEAIQKKDDTLADRVDERLLARKFGELTYTMQEMVHKAVRDKAADEGHEIIDDFAGMSKAVVSELVDRGLTSSWSFLEVFEERIELQKGQLSKSRVERIDLALTGLIDELLDVRKMMRNADVVDDSIVEEVAKKVRADDEAEKSEFVKAAEAKMKEVEDEHKAKVEELTEVLANPQPIPPKGSDAESVEVELSPEDRVKRAKRMFTDSVMRGKK